MKIHDKEVTVDAVRRQKIDFLPWIQELEEVPQEVSQLIVDFNLQVSKRTEGLEKIASSLGDPTLNSVPLFQDGAKQLYDKYMTTFQGCVNQFQNIITDAETREENEFISYIGALEKALDEITTDINKLSAEKPEPAEEASKSTLSIGESTSSEDTNEEEILALTQEQTLLRGRKEAAEIARARMKSVYSGKEISWDSSANKLVFTSCTPSGVTINWNNNGEPLVIKDDGGAVTAYVLTGSDDEGHKYVIRTDVETKTTTYYTYEGEAAEENLTHKRIEQWGESPIDIEYHPDGTSTVTQTVSNGDNTTTTYVTKYKADGTTDGDPESYVLDEQGQIIDNYKGTKASPADLPDDALDKDKYSDVTKGAVAEEVVGDGDVENPKEVTADSKKVAEDSEKVETDDLTVDAADAESVIDYILKTGCPNTQNLAIGTWTTDQGEKIRVEEVFRENGKITGYKLLHNPSDGNAPYFEYVTEDAIFVVDDNDMISSLTVPSYSNCAGGMGLKRITMGYQIKNRDNGLFDATIFSGETAKFTYNADSGKLNGITILNGDQAREISKSDNPKLSFQMVDHMTGTTTYYKTSLKDSPIMTVSNGKIEVGGETITTEQIEGKVLLTGSTMGGSLSNRTSGTYWISKDGEDVIQVVSSVWIKIDGKGQLWADDSPINEKDYIQIPQDYYEIVSKK